MLPIPLHHRASLAFSRLRFSALGIVVSLGIAPCSAALAEVPDPALPGAANHVASVTTEEPLLKLAQRLTLAPLAVDDAFWIPSGVASTSNASDLPPVTPSPAARADSTAATSPMPRDLSTRSPADLLPLGPRPGTSQPAGHASEAPPAGSDLWSMGAVVQTLAALALVLGLIYLMRWLLRQWSGQGAVALAGSSGKVVEVLARSTISPKSNILVLRVGHRLLVASDTPAGINTLATIEDPDEIATMLSLVHAQRPDSISGQFRQMLEHFNGQYEGPLYPKVPKSLADLDDPGGDETEIITDRSRDEVTSLLARLRRMNAEAGRS